jgi:hypothetical protein
MLKDLFRAIQAQGYPGGYGRVCAFVRRWKDETTANPKRAAFVPLHLRAGRSLPVRLELRVRLRRRLKRGGWKWRIRSCAPQPRLLAGGLSEPEPRDAVRCPCPGLCRLRRRAAPRHLRQHEDGGRQGRPRQGAHGQCALPRHERALPVRCRVLQPWPPAGRRASSRRTCRTGAGRSGGRPASGAGPIWTPSTPGWPNSAGRLGVDGPSGMAGAHRGRSCWQDEQMHLMPNPRPFDGYVEQPVRSRPPRSSTSSATATACRANRPTAW